uniref:Uncharacterized protein n=1 Tax=Cannabis sativa TaxID=3483 RepID=A0A803PPS7_CANSA
MYLRSREMAGPKDWLKLNYDVRVGLSISCIVVVGRTIWGRWSGFVRLDWTLHMLFLVRQRPCCLAFETAKLNSHKFVIVETLGVSSTLSTASRRIGRLRTTLIFGLSSLIVLSIPLGKGNPRKLRPLSILATTPI